MKVLMDKGLAKGTVVVFGTPAEESTSGKATFVNKNAVKTNVDFAMMLVSISLLLHRRKFCV
jgi:metal-dependent amidase/aminoacylase/carboxypeptidase family protein